MANNIFEFKPEYVNQLLANTGLNDVLDELYELDFINEFYSDNPQIIKQYDGLKQCLRSEGLENKRDKINEEIRKLTPDIEDQIIICVLNLIRIMENCGFRLSKFEDGCYRLYTSSSHYWKMIDEGIINHFLVSVAEKSGIKRSLIIHLKNMKMLREHFDEQSRIVSPEAKEMIATINLQNGTFEVSPNFIGLREHRYSDFHNYILSFSYDETAECPRFKDFLNRIIPEKNAQLAIAELFAYPLIKGLKLEIAGVLQGPGGSGKSTLADIIKSIYGEENVASYALSSICGTSQTCAYNRADLNNYIFNYSSEMGSEKCDFNLVKKLISREPIEARYPYGKPFILRDYCPTFFNVNNLPIMENTSAYWRRFKIFEIPNPIPLKEVDKDFAKRIIEKERSGILNWLIEGLLRLMKNRNITDSKLCEDTKTKLRRESDSVAYFLYDKDYEKSSNDYEIGADLYKKFSKYCEECGLRKLSSIKFYSRLEELGIKVQRKATDGQYRVFCFKKQSQNIKNTNYDNDITKMFGLPDCNE